jgi:hypothetical protein
MSEDDPCPICRRSGHEKAIELKGGRVVFVCTRCLRFYGSDVEVPRPDEVRVLGGVVYKVERVYPPPDRG